MSEITSVIFQGGTTKASDASPEALFEWRQMRLGLFGDKILAMGGVGVSLSMFFIILLQDTVGRDGMFQLFQVILVWTFLFATVWLGYRLIKSMFNDLSRRWRVTLESIEVTTRTRLFGSSTEVFKYSDITSAILSQSSLGEKLHYGTITVGFSSDLRKPYVFPDVENPKLLHDYLVTIVEKNNMLLASFDVHQF